MHDICCCLTQLRPGPTKSILSVSLKTQAEPGVVVWWNVASLWSPGIMTEISRNICLASDRRLVTGHHWSCANIDLDTWGRSKSPSYQESSQPRSNCSPGPAWTLSPGQWLRLIFVCLVLRESRMLAKMPNIAAESYGRATLNKLDFLGIRNVSVFQVSFNLTVIPIDGAVLHAIVTCDTWSSVSVSDIPPWLCNGQTLFSTKLSYNCAPAAAIMAQRIE